MRGTCIYVALAKLGKKISRLTPNKSSEKIMAFVLDLRMLHTPGLAELAANRFLKSLMPSLVLAFYDTTEPGQEKSFNKWSCRRCARGKNPRHGENEVFIEPD